MKPSSKSRTHLPIHLRLVVCLLAAGLAALFSAQADYVVTESETLSTAVADAAGIVTSDATLTIASGGSLSVTDFYAAYPEQGSGGVVIEAGGNLAVSGNFIVGAGFFGALTLNGGSVNADIIKLSDSGYPSPGIATLNGGVLTASQIQRYNVDSTLSFNGGTLRASGNTSALLLGFGAGSTTLQAGGGMIDTQSFSVNLPAVLEGPGGLAKLGEGVLTLTATNTYAGNTTVAAGTLVIDGSISGSAITVSSGGKLGGSGQVGSLSVVGGVLAPGSSPGELHAGDTIFGAGGAYEWEINAASGNLGENWDFLDITGSLSITATNSSKFVISILSLTQGNVPGNVFDFNAGGIYTWTIAVATGGISGFSAGKFLIDTAGFTNDYSGTFSIVQDGNALNVVYSAVPEPSLVLLVTVGFAGLAALRLRRVTDSGKE